MLTMELGESRSQGSKVEKTRMYMKTVYMDQIQNKYHGDTAWHSEIPEKKTAKESIFGNWCTK